MRLRTWFVVVVALCVAAGGCGRPRDDGTARPTATTTGVGPSVTTTEPADDDGDDMKLSEIFSLKNKVDEVRYLYEHGQPSYAVRQAEGLLSQLPPNSRERLELHFLMARCYERLGEDGSRKQHDKAFRQMLEEMGNSAEHKQAMRDGANLRVLVQRSIDMGASTAARPAGGEDDVMFNVRCANRLQRVSTDQVLHENIEPDGEIYYGRKGDEVREQAASGMGCSADDVVIQRDPRFDFYFCIVEKKP